NLTYGAVTGSYTSYCVLENSTTIGTCSWVNGTLPTTYVVSAVDNSKVLSVWIRDAAGNTSARVDTNSVDLDATAPVLASFAISNSSPTNTTTYSLTYGAITGTYSHYCIKENDTSVAGCTWTAAAVPASTVVGATENAKTLSIW